MNKLRCDICGGTLVMQAGGTVAVCDSCGMQYSTDRMREKVQEIRGTVSVEGVVKTESADFNVQGGMLVSYHGAATEVIVPDSVSIIGEQAFCGMKGIEKVILPESVVEIEEKAFKDCVHLTGVFHTEGVVKIGESAFYNCINLKTINLTNSLSEIGKYAFWGCANLESVTLPSNLSQINDGVFFHSGVHDVAIPDGVREIGIWAFSNCEKLTSISLPTSLLEIGQAAFSACINLEKIELPPRLGKMDYGAFACCCKLHSINLPDSLIEIREGAFWGCINLNNVTVSDALINRLFKIKTSSNNYKFSVQEWAVFSKPKYKDISGLYIDSYMEMLEKASPWYEKLYAGILKTESEKYYMAVQRCRHCGGAFKGFFTQRCEECGRSKDY